MHSARNVLRSLLLVAAVVGVTLPAGAALAEPSAQEVQQQIDKQSTDLERIVEDYNRTTEQLKTTQAAAADLTAKLGPLEQQLATATANVSAIGAQAYRRGGQISTATTLLNGGRPDTTLQSLASLDRLAKIRQRDVSQYTTARKQYQAQKAQLDATLAQQTNQQKSLSDRKATIEADLAKLEARKRQLNQQAAAAQAAAKRANSSSGSGSSSGGGSGSGGGSSATPPPVSGAAGVAVRYAYGALGKPYVWAADGPGSYDCSGLTLAAWRAAGVSLPHNAAMQWDRVSHISRSSLAPGDLVFYSGLGHVAIYVGNNQVIHAPTFGDVVKISSVDMMKPYGYGRVR